MQEKMRQTGCDTGDAATTPGHHEQCHATTLHWRRQQACTDQEKTAGLLSVDEKKQYPLTSKPLRRNTAAHKHSSPTKDALIGLLLHLSTLAAPQDDFVLPVCTVACARNPVDQRLPQRHPKKAPAFLTSMPKHIVSLPPQDVE